MLARLDNLPQRHRSVTLHAAGPDVDFRTPIRCERIPGRHDACSRNFPSRACHAKPLAIGISLAEIAGIKKILAAAGPRRASRLAYRLRKLRKLRKPPPWPARPMPRQARGQGGKGGKVGNPFFGPYSGAKVFLGAPLEGKMARPSSSSTTRRQFRGSTGIGGRGFYGGHLLKAAVAKPREQSENSQSFQCGKAANPGQWCLLIPAFCVPKLRSLCASRYVRD
jgi:hypothetical protein